MSSIHTWEKIWREESLFKDAWEGRPPEPRHSVSCDWPPMEDHLEQDPEETWASLTMEGVTGSDGLVNTLVELPKKWGTYDVILVAVAPSRASASWCTPVDVGPVSWSFRPPRVMQRGEVRAILIACQNLLGRTLEVRITLGGVGLTVLGEPTVTVAISPGEEVEVQYTTRMGYLEEALWECSFVVGDETRTLRERTLLVPVEPGWP